MIKYCYRCEKDVELIKDPESNAQLCEICGTILIHSASKLPAGTILSGFQIIEEIGRGGMGIVYLAKQLNLERNVALKVLADDLAQDEEFVASFFKEARAAASLNHPNIVQVFDAGSTVEGIYFFAMELIEGETLEQKIERDGAIDPKRAMRIAVKIADALSYAWDTQKLTHGDIKPDNIILNSSGGAKLADLGLAKFMHDDDSDAGIMATPLYAPPEIIKGEKDKIGSQSDMYSFGATLFQMLTGVPLYPDDLPEVVLKKHLNQPPPLLSNYNPRFAPALVQLVSQLLEKDPDERPFSWGDISSALKKIKEPEIEGKVFHTHHHENEEQEIVEVEEPEKKNFLPLIGLLMAILVGLLIAITLIVVGDDKVKDEEPDNTIKPNESNLSKEDAQKELEIVKSQLKFLKPQDAIAQLDRILNKYGSSAPLEAKFLRERQVRKHKNMLKRIEIIKAERTQFKTSVLALKKELTTVNANTPIDTIKSLSKKIEIVLQKTASKSYLTITASDKSLFNAEYMKLSKMMMKNKQEQERLAKIRAAERKQRMLEELKKKKEAIEKKYQEKLTINKTIDNYYKILAEFLDNHSLNDFKNNLSNWNESSKAIPAEYSIKVDFIKNKAIPNYEKFVPHLIKYADFIVGQPLPLAVCPPKYRKYKVKEINETGIKLIYTEEKISMGYTLKWTKMPAKVIALLVQERLYSDPKANTFSRRENLTALSYLVMKAPKYCDEIIGLAKLNNNEKRMWKYIAKDLIVAEDEDKLIKLYNSFLESYELKDFIKASNIFLKLKKSSQLTEFGKRYADELEKIESSIMGINPIVPAQIITDEYMKEKGVADNPKKLFNACMVAEARYKKILDEKMQESLTKVKTESLQKLVEESGITEINANRIPFYYWDMEKTGTSWAYYIVVKNAGKLDEKVLNSMALAAALDNGDWVTAKNIFEQQETLDIANLEQMTTTANWASSFIFARGIMFWQYGNWEKCQEALAALIRVAQNQNIPAMKPLTTSLAIEYALMTRQPSRALELGRQYEYQMGPMARIEARIALLNILAMIENTTINPANIRYELQTYFKNFQNIPKMNMGDMAWAKLAINLINGKFEASDIKRLRSAKCDFPDVSARILTAGWARSLCIKTSNLPPQTKKELLREIHRNISSIFVANETWRKYTILALALHDQPQKMIKTANKALEDYRISTTRFYPELIILKAGAEKARGLFSKEETTDKLEKFLRASVLTSTYDLKTLNLISANNPELLVNKFFTTNLGNKAFVSAVLCMMVNHKNKNTFTSINTILNENSKLLSWEEKLLAKQINNW